MTKSDSGTNLKALSRTDLVAIKQGSKRLTLGAKLRANPLLKFIALIVTLTLFFFVLSDRKTNEAYENIPINLIIPENYALQGAHTNLMASVLIQGRASVLKKVTRNDLGLISITPPAREGRAQINLSKDMMKLPEGVKILKFTPEFITLDLETLEHRKVQVSTDHAFTGDLLAGYQLGEVVVDPPSIEISGPKSVVEEIQQVYIEPINLSARANSFVVNRWVIPTRPGIVKMENTMVRVSVSLVSQSKERVILGVPIVSLNLTHPHQFIPKTADLVLIGDENSLSKIEASTLFIAIDAGEDEKLPSHARIVKITNANIPNLPAGVAVKEEKIPTIVLKTTVANSSENSNNLSSGALH